MKPSDSSTTLDARFSFLSNYYAQFLHVVFLMKPL
jgi:hypothetical protein